VLLGGRGRGAKHPRSFFPPGRLLDPVAVEAGFRKPSFAELGRNTGVEPGDFF